jgi:hypothetical protein
MEEKWRVNAAKLIDVAKRNLEEMRTMFANRHYYGTVNRAYYSMFHVVSALLTQVRQLAKLNLVFTRKILKSLHYKFGFGANRAGGFSLSF